MMTDKSLLPCPTPEMIEAVAKAIAACDDQDDWIAWEHNQPASGKVYREYAAAAITAARQNDPLIERMREALDGLVEGVRRHCNEPGGCGISGYLGARLSDARSTLAALTPPVNSEGMEG